MLAAASISKYSFNEYDYANNDIHDKHCRALSPRDMNPGHDSACSVHMAGGDIISHHLDISGHVCSD